MRSLSETIRKLLQRLSPLPQPVEVAHADWEYVTNIQGARCRGLEGVPELYSLLHSKESTVAEAAANALDAILLHVSCQQLATLDRKVREVSEWRTPPIGSEDVQRLAQGRTRVLGLLSFDRTGYVREAAIRELANKSGVAGLAFMLIRLNDWVLQVRNVAEIAVRARLRDEYADEFARNILLVSRLQQQGRGEHRKLVNEVFTLLTSPEGRPSLKRMVGDRDSNRLAFNLLMEGDHRDQSEVILGALDSDDVVLQLRAAQRAREDFDEAALRPVLERLWTHRVMPLRREALYGFVERFAEESGKRLTVALLDPHVSIREAARFYLKQSGFDSFRDAYRAALDEVADVRLIAAALAGLGETGTIADVSSLLPFLGHADARIRRAAVRSIGYLDPDGNADQLFRMLQDRSAGVANAARRVITTQPAIKSSSALWKIFESSENDHTKRMALSLIGECTWWESAAYLLRAVGSDSKELSDRAIEYLERWRGNSGRNTVRPSAEQLQVVETALAANRSKLNQRLLDDLDATLRDAR